MANITVDSFTESSEAPVPPWLELIEFITELLYKWWMVVSVGLGVPGNMMSLLITMKEDNRQISTCIYMAALAIVDTGVLIFAEMLYKLCIAHRLVTGLEGNRLFLSFMWYGADGFAVCSGLFLAQMSVDRAIAVIYPMKAATICTASRALKITITTGILELLVHTQTFFVLDVPDPPNGALIRNFPDARWWETFYNAYLLILGTIIPFSTLVVCNTIIIIGVNRAARRRKKMKSDTAEKPGKLKDANLTTMMLMTSFAYLVLSSPRRMYEAFAAVDIDSRSAQAIYWLGFWICTELWKLNYAVNFYIYFLGGGKKFRQDAKDIFKRCCCFRSCFVCAK